MCKITHENNSKFTQANTKVFTKRIYPTLIFDNKDTVKESKISIDFAKDNKKSPLVTIKKGSYFFAINVIEKTNIHYSAKDNGEVFYESDDICYEYSPIINGVKEKIILKEKKNDALKFLIDTKNISLELDKENEIQIKDKNSGTHIGRIPKFFMFDSSEEEKYSENIKLALEIDDNNADRYILGLMPDIEFLNNENVKYPITIDPTITFDDAANWANTYTESANPNKNNYLDTNLKIGYSESTGTMIAFVKLKELPDMTGATISSVKFKLYKYANTSGLGIYINLNKITQDWDETTLTHNNTPTFNSSYEDRISAGLNGWKSFTITSLFNDWMNATQPNYGFVLKTDDNIQKEVDFYSSNSDKVPYIEINYSTSSLSAPTNFLAQGYSLGVNSGKGYINMTWDPVANATGYKIGVFNGREYQYFDAGNTTSWTTQNNGIWPTQTEIENGSYALHTDGLGDDLPNSPKNTYSNAGGLYQNSNIYKVNVVAYNQFNESSNSSTRTDVTLPDSTPPSNPTNVITTFNENINISWGPSTDYPTGIASGIDHYKVKLYKESDPVYVNLVDITHPNNSATFSEFLTNTTYHATIQAYDVNENYSQESMSNSIITSNTPQDIIPPSAPTSVQLNKTTWDNASSVTVIWTGITDNVAVQDVQYSLDNSTWTSTGTNAENGQVELNTFTFPQGEQKIYIRGIDTSNNVGNAVYATYYKDTIDPSVSINNLFQEISGVVPINITVYDANIKEWVLEYALNNEQPSFITIVSGNNNISSQNVINWNTNLLENGSYLIRLRAEDVAGNISQTNNTNITINNLAQEYSITTNKEEFDLVITAENFTNINNRDIIVTYDINDVEVIDLSVMTNKKTTTIGQIDGTNINITNISPGNVTFRVSIDIPNQKVWSGVLNIIRFKNNTTGNVTVSYAITK